MDAATKAVGIEQYGDEVPVAQVIVGGRALATGVVGILVQPAATRSPIASGALVVGVVVAAQTIELPPEHFNNGRVVVVVGDAEVSAAVQYADANPVVPAVPIIGYRQVTTPNVHDGAVGRLWSYVVQVYEFVRTPEAVQAIIPLFMQYDGI